MVWVSLASLAAYWSLRTTLFQATAVIPGSHLWNLDRTTKVEECTYAEMDCLRLAIHVFESRVGVSLTCNEATYHGAGSNKCEKGDEDTLRSLRVRATQ